MHLHCNCVGLELYLVIEFGCSPFRAGSLVDRVPLEWSHLVGFGCSLCWHELLVEKLTQALMVRFAAAGQGAFVSTAVVNNGVRSLAGSERWNASLSSDCGVVGSCHRIRALSVQTGVASIRSAPNFASSRSGKSNRNAFVAAPKSKQPWCLAPRQCRDTTARRLLCSFDGYNAVMIVPTGTAARIGGFAGDALPACRLLAGVCDTLVTHPNVLNGAMLYWAVPNALYVEGYALDRFCEGLWGLMPQRGTANRIGVVFDRAVPSTLLERHLQVCDAARATLGIQVTAYTVTREPVRFRCGLHDDGSSYGVVDAPGTLIEAAASLLEPPHNCDALAIICYFPPDMIANAGEMLERYRQGKGVDPIAGAEAALSRTVTTALKVPCAHAPALNELHFSAERCNPKAAAEELGHTFLPCVLAGLARAPRLILKDEVEREKSTFALWIDEVAALVTPSNALSSPAVQATLQRGKLVVAVKENTTCLNGSPWDFPVNVLEVRDDGALTRHQRVASDEAPWVLWVRSYAEAAGYLVAHREGVLFDAITPAVPGIREALPKSFMRTVQPTRVDRVRA
jgi:hypothetical protein